MFELPSFFRTKNKLKSHEKVCKNNDLCGIVLPFQKDNILKFNQHMKSDKTTCITYANLESLIYKIDRCPNNPEELQQQNTKPGEHIPCGHSMSTIWPFDNIENKHRLYRGKGCMKKFCISLREIVINFEKQKLLPLLEKELKLHQDSMLCYIKKKIHKKTW